ncbi:MAG: phosphoribosylglycinamide formyltransferase [Phycisphaerales bacterium]|nr:phosphoribosylglycinamide formyltransferase [Phycisphaerales bacterium]
MSAARLAVLLSGSGRTLLNLHDEIRARRLDAEIALVIASRECLGAERARERGLETVVVPSALPADVLEKLLGERRIDWVVLAGYLRMVKIPPAYEGRVVNIHPALLPSFGGPGMHGEKVHAAVLARGCKVSGCTVHLCDAKYDNGPILVQLACEVKEHDTPETLAARVFELERQAYPEALRLLIAGRACATTGSPRAIIRPDACITDPHSPE